MREISGSSTLDTAATHRSTRDRILDSALFLFSEQGFKGATTKAIAAQAGVNESTLFRNFSSKENLFRTLVERETDLREALANLPEPGSGNPVADLTEIGLYIAGQMEPRTRLAKIIISEAARLDLGSLAGRAPQQGATRLTGIFRELGAREPYVASVAFLSFILRSILFQAFIGSDPLVTLDRDTIKKFAEILVHGMKGA